MIENITDENAANIIIEAARSRSEELIATLRVAAEEFFEDGTEIIVGVNGSVARREVTGGSDVDLFILTLPGTEDCFQKRQEEFYSNIEGRGIKMPAAGGVFDRPLCVSELNSYIGGEEDTNLYLTRRLLYLLEGDWIYNQEQFNELRRNLVDRYVSDDIEQRKLTRYLLNDLIRYWRTICVDFEFKTADALKPRAIRLIKLRLSRMMLYFGGVAAVRETAAKPASEKREILVNLFNKPPLERVKAVYAGESVKVCNAYATFLSCMDDSSIRAALERPGIEGLDTEVYRELCKVARAFKAEVLRLVLIDGTEPGSIAEAVLL